MGERSNLRLGFGLSYGVSPREPLDRVGGLARLAEESGFGRLWFVDVQLSMKDVFVAMTLAAQGTERLKVGPGVSNPVTRHLSVLANGINAIHEISGGRAVLGFGAGHTAVYPVGLKPATIADFSDAVRDTRTLLHGESAVRDGAEFTLQTAPEHNPPPIYVAATQRRMLRTAGRMGDGAIVLGAADPDLVAWQIERIHEGLREGGRNRADIAIDLWVGLSLDDPSTALRDVKAFAAAQARVLNRWQGDIPGPLGEFRDEFRRADEEYRLGEHLSVQGDNRELVSDELASRIAVAGDVHTCTSRLRDLMKLDLDGLTLTLLSGGREERLKRIGRELLPELNTG